MQLQPISALGALALCLGAMFVPRAQDDSGSAPDAVEVITAQAGFVHKTHLGDWAGANRLWVTDPAQPFRSEGTLSASNAALSYTWSHEGAEHRGTLEFFGQAEAMRADWNDSWHAADGLTLHGFSRDGILRLFGTYPAGEDVEWGWQIEIDMRDREALVMRMFNVMPHYGAVPALVLDGRR